MMLWWFATYTQPSEDGGRRSSPLMRTLQNGARHSCAHTLLIRWCSRRRLPSSANTNGVVNSITVMPGNESKKVHATKSTARVCAMKRGVFLAGSDAPFAPALAPKSPLGSAEAAPQRRPSTGRRTAITQRSATLRRDGVAGLRGARTGRDVVAHAPRPWHRVAHARAGIPVDAIGRLRPLQGCLPGLSPSAESLARPGGRGVRSTRCARWGGFSISACDFRGAAAGTLRAQIRVPSCSGRDPAAAGMPRHPTQGCHGGLRTGGRCPSRFRFRARSRAATCRFRSNLRVWTSRCAGSP